jgi:ATP-dependent protease ClpP protease subunit
MPKKDSTTADEVMVVPVPVYSDPIHETIPRTELLHKFHKTAKDFLATLDPEDEYEPVGLMNGIIPLLIEEVPVAAFDPIRPEDRGIIFFQTDVTETSVSGMCNSVFQVHLSLPKGALITLYLSSMGGDIYSGMSLVSTIFEIQRQGRVVNIHVQGCALSMASLVLQAANHRSIDRSAYIMLHELASGFQGKLSDQKDELKNNKRLEQTCLEIYSARTGKPTTYYADKTRKKDWYLTADEALKEKLVDEVKAWPLFSLANVRPIVRKKRTKIAPVTEPAPSKEVTDAF